jgi:hypothetical protein
MHDGNMSLARLGQSAQADLVSQQNGCSVCKPFERSENTRRPHDQKCFKDNHRRRTVKAWDVRTMGCESSKRGQGCLASLEIRGAGVWAIDEWFETCNRVTGMCCEGNKLSILRGFVFRNKTFYCVYIMMLLLKCKCQKWAWTAVGADVALLQLLHSDMQC